MNRPASRSRICLVTTGHPSTNPRLVKEADALSAAGHDVRVVACKFSLWADRADAEFSNRPWSVAYVRFGEMADRLRHNRLRLRRMAALRAAALVGPSRGIGERALHYIVPELGRVAAARPADLFIAHNLAALPAAARAAAQHDARLGFDAEDFHRGELPAGQSDSHSAGLIRWVEEQYIPRCHYVTAASDGIADAYAEALSIARPTTILNVFPRAARDVELSATGREVEKPEGTVSLYWFSQTIGAGRGLEDVVAALPRLPGHVMLTVRGQWDRAFEDHLLRLARELGVFERVRALPPEAPREMVVRAACHDLGLALEQPETHNRAICVTNKIFTYLLAGIPAVATNTPGQKQVCLQVPQATVLVPSGDPATFATAVRSLIDASGLVRPSARQAAAQAGERFNWDVEQGRFLSLVSDTLTSVP